MAAVPSAESLSTTMISAERPALALRTDPSACARNSRTLYVTMTTVTSIASTATAGVRAVSAGSARGVGAGAGSPRV
jgi:hypothetical protein